MSNVKLFQYLPQPDGSHDFEFTPPDYRGQRRELIKINKHIPNYSQLVADEILQDAQAEAQGIYDTWMQEVDKQLGVPATVEQTLKQRGNVHGDYNVQSTTHDQLLHVMMKQPSFLNLKPQHRQALNIIAMKMSRILSGDAEHTDHWHDIAGYATLAEKACAFVDPNQQELDLGR